jgi:hypothetical protein
MKFENKQELNTEERTETLMNNNHIDYTSMGIIDAAALKRLFDKLADSEYFLICAYRKDYSLEQNKERAVEMLEFMKDKEFQPYSIQAGRNGGMIDEVFLLTQAGKYKGKELETLVLNICQKFELDSCLRVSAGKTAILNKDKTEIIVSKLGDVNFCYSMISGIEDHQSELIGLRIPGSPVMGAITFSKLGIRF